MVSSWIRPGRPTTLAHRGQCAHVPENTMLSFRSAIERGTEMIETDAHLSRDGELVVMHDDTLERTTNGHGRVADLTWDELSRLDAGSWFGPEFTDLRIPRVAEVIDLARTSGIGLCLEAKEASTAEATSVAVALAHLIAAKEATSWAFVSGFDHAAMMAARAAVPSLLLAPERLPERGPQDPEETLRQALALGTPILQHRWELITPTLVDILHESGVGIWAWTTNDIGSVRVSLALGVDGIMGDDVDVLNAGRSTREPWVRPHVDR